MSPPLGIAVLYNTDYDAEVCATDVISVEASARAVAAALTDGGFAVELIGLYGLEGLAVIDRIRASARDLVFNLCESMAGDPRNEPTFVGLLDLFGIPYTGADLLCLASCLHKRRAKDVLLARGFDASYSCLEGVCSSCETRVIAGIPDHRDLILTSEERAAGDRMMICCSRARTNRS